MKKTIISLILLSALCLIPGRGVAGEHRIGAGATYWVCLKDLDRHDLDESGLSYFLTWQYRAALVGIEAALEWMPDHIGEDTLAPQAYLIVGGGLYAAAGIGVLYLDGGFADKPFYALKAGMDLGLLPALSLDLSANYRFTKRSDLDDRERNIGIDTVFLGAALRLKL